MAKLAVTLRFAVTFRSVRGLTVGSVGPVHEVVAGVRDGCDRRTICAVVHGLRGFACQAATLPAV